MTDRITDKEEAIIDAAIHAEDSEAFKDACAGMGHVELPAGLRINIQLGHIELFRHEEGVGVVRFIIFPNELIQVGQACLEAGND